MSKKTNFIYTLPEKNPGLMFKIIRENRSCSCGCGATFETTSRAPLQYAPACRAAKKAAKEKRATAKQMQKRAEELKKEWLSIRAALRNSRFNYRDVVQWTGLTRRAVDILKWAVKEGYITTESDGRVLWYRLTGKNAE